jgi:hypothetical protein
LFQFFRECKQNNEAFYWDVDFDPKTKVLRSIFWSHASQRAEYVDFGDVITFDSTHKTNSKKIPLAMFIGCSNNLKNVSFGQALLRDETIDTFRWLFESFKSCMGGRQPFVILTGTYFEGGRGYILIFSIIMLKKMIAVKKATGECSVVATFATLNSIFWLRPSSVLNCENILFTGKRLI